MANIKRLLRLPRLSSAAVCAAGSGTPSPLNYHEITLNFKDSFIKTQVLPAICDERDARAPLILFKFCTRATVSVQG